MSKLAVILLTYNNDVHIEKTLNSINSFCIDCHVIDSGSTDMTIKISESLASTVTINKLENWDAGLQRNFAYEKFRNYYEYILFWIVMKN